MERPDHSHDARECPMHSGQAIPVLICARATWVRCAHMGATWAALMRGTIDGPGARPYAQVTIATVDGHQGGPIPEALWPRARQHVASHFDGGIAGSRWPEMEFERHADLVREAGGDLTWDAYLTHEWPYGD